MRGLRPLQRPDSCPAARGRRWAGLRPSVHGPLLRLEASTADRWRAARLSRRTKVHFRRSLALPRGQEGEAGGQEGKGATRELQASIGEIGQDSSWGSVRGDRQAGGKAAKLRAAAVLRSGSVGWGEQRLALLCLELRRGEGGAHGEGDWEAGDRAAAGHGGRAVQAALVNDGSEGPGYVSLG